MTIINTAKGLHFEDFVVGDVYVTGRRTITATDIVNFAALSGDFGDVHSNHEYCRATPFGEPIAHAPLVFAAMAGLHYASGINQGTLIAMLQIDRWRMHHPVKHGDTLRSVSTVAAKRETSDPARGIVTFHREFKNQHDVVVQSMEATVMYRRKPDQGMGEAGQ